MAKVNPYLNFPGTTEAAFNFYKSVFGGEFVMFMRFKDVGGMDHLSDEDKEKIMHISLPIGDGTILMATDSMEAMGQKLQTGNNFYLAIGTGSTEEADKMYAALSEGGTKVNPMKKEFWGAYFGMLTDKFGIQWMISYDEQRPE